MNRAALRGGPRRFLGHNGAVLIPLGPTRAIEVVSTDRSHGDFAVSSTGIAERRGRLMPTPWTWLNLVHGASVIEVAGQGEGAGSKADGAWTAAMDTALAVTTADCAPVVLGAASAVGAALAVVHAGWRGLEAGVVDTAAALVRARAGDGAQLVAFCGPCIGPEHYEFSTVDLDRVADALAPSVRALTADGAPALDMFAGVAVALARSGFPVPERPPSTASPQFFSHRMRSDPERMTTVARMIRTDQ